VPELRELGFAEVKYMHINRYIAVSARSKCLYCPVVSPVRGLRVISMSLYGSKMRYVVGAIRNAQLAPVIFPGWQIRVYCKSSGLALQLRGVSIDRKRTSYTTRYL